MPRPAGSAAPAVVEGRRFSALRAFVWGLAAAGAFDALFGCAFPGFSLALLALLAPTPLLIAAWMSPRPAWTALGVFVGTTPMWLLHHRWLLDVTLPGTPVLALIMAFYPAFFVLIAGRLRMRWPRWPIATCSATGIRSGCPRRSTTI